MNAASPSSDTARESPRRFQPDQRLLGALLVLLVVAAYARVRFHGFIWDDESHLTRNPCIIGPLGFSQIWTTGHAVYYPLVLTSFWVLHQLIGLNPVPYHVLNVLMHAASALLLWRVLRELGIRAAWFASAVWALHPVMVQSVAWITELKNTQSSVFYLLSILCFLKADSASRSNRSPAFGFFCAILFFVMAITSKPSTVMLPIVLALCLWWGERLRPRSIGLLMPFVVISIGASLWTVWEQKFHSGAIGPEWAEKWPERIIIASRALWFYLGKLLWPQSLTFIYPRWEIDASRPFAYVPVAAAAIALGASWFGRNGRWRAVSFAGAYFVISLFPILGFFDVYFFRYSFVSDHFQYLASMGPLALAGVTLGYAFDLVSSRQSTKTIGFGMILCLLGWLTWRQTAVYHDVVTLYQDTIKKNPGCWMAHYNLAIALRGRGQSNEAEAHYREAIALHPNYAEAHYNLARILVERGELNNAIGHYQKALAINPADPEASNNLGITLVQAGRLDEAIACYRKAITIKPDYAEALSNLGTVLLRKGDLQGAIKSFRASLTIWPDQAVAHFNLGNAFLRSGRADEAISHYRRMLDLQPENSDGYANLGNALLQKGQVKEAIDQYRHALRISPANLPAQTNLAWLLATSANPALRNGPEAVRLAESASRSSRVASAVILRILAAAYAENGDFVAATDTAEQALHQAESEHNDSLVAALERELVLYRSGSPYHKSQS